jgi:uncharacterized protein YbjT (DUF2867 family)
MEPTSPQRGRTALLAGTTGLVGGHLLEALLGRQEYTSVVALSRRPIDHRDPRLDTRLVDFDRLDEGLADLRPDHVFCALGTTIRKAGSRHRFRVVDLDYPVTLARLTRAAGARHFALVSSMGASPSARTFYLRIKGEVEAAVAQCDWPSLTIAQPSIIQGPRTERRPAERLGEWLSRWGPRAIRPVPARAIAQALVDDALREQSGTTVLDSAALRAVMP